MELKISREKPAWADGVGHSYDTTFLYTGRGRINMHMRMYETFEGMHMFERPFTGGVVSRVYDAEAVSITEYSKSPRRWKEDTPTGTWYYSQLRRIPS